MILLKCSGVVVEMRACWLRAGRGWSCGCFEGQAPYISGIPEVSLRGSPALEGARGVALPDSHAGLVDEAIVGSLVAV